MRIHQLTYSTKPRGGVVHTLALAEALAARGHEVTVWTLGRGGDRAFFRDVEPAVRVRVVPFAPRDDEAVGPRIVRSIAVLAAALAAAARDEGAPDVVHAQDCISANAALDAGLAPVRTVHHLDRFTTPQLVACHERAIVAPVARLAVSGAVADELAAGWGLRPAIVGNGVDADRFAAAVHDPRTARWRQRLGPYVLALGGIEPRKGTLDLLEAWALLRVRRPDVRLVLAGGETLFDYRDYRAAFDARVEALAAGPSGDAARPVVLGTVDEADLAPLVAGAAALGFVSVQEGFGLAALEALAAGVPVVARRLPVLEEVFGGTVAYGQDPRSFADALDRVLGGDAPDPAAGRALAAGARWDDVAARHEAAYAAVLRDGGDGGAALDLGGAVLAR
ncbi:MSMEG_0565 family glycosyltransferase [Cellulomonas marina]|uniref:Glycosyltransferase, MSMEG_0565 family n=1 Tax=Cellulomonas marina TaxID=988821 RepID=A0A1I0XT18_9CELL|nr:MSMEG_0565 family glycosyltransferase [Cellulomonas marina]GIG30008.1 glycosyl transferase family 1 [Cellulomonas marina]SFB03586.1 glycosyltransferase, MSMEG_0565 family [Cellulomonas marina]